MSNHNPPTNRFQQLRWRLTLTYTAVTIGALLTVELILLGVAGVGIITLINSGFIPAQLNSPGPGRHCRMVGAGRIRINPPTILRSH